LIQGLIALAADLSARGIDFRSLTDGFDTSTASGRLLFHILASVAEMERELVKERTIAGLAAAREKGSTGGGRKLVMTPDRIDTARKLLAVGEKPARIAKLLGVGLSTFYRQFPASNCDAMSGSPPRPGSSGNGHRGRNLQVRDSASPQGEGIFSRDFPVKRSPALSGRTYFAAPRIRAAATQIIRKFRFRGNLAIQVPPYDCRSGADGVTPKSSWFISLGTEASQGAPTFGTKSTFQAGSINGSF
jgi:hypothetical protein